MRAGLIVPDEKRTIMISGRPYAPKGEEWKKAISYWKPCHQIEIQFIKEIEIKADSIELVTWGTSPQDVALINGQIPDPKDFKDLNRRNAIERSLEYMDLNQIKNWY